MTNKEINYALKQKKHHKVSWNTIEVGTIGKLVSEIYKKFSLSSIWFDWLNEINTQATKFSLKSCSTFELSFQTDHTDWIHTWTEKYLNKASEKNVGDIICFATLVYIYTYNFQGNRTRNITTLSNGHKCLFINALSLHK